MLGDILVYLFAVFSTWYGIALAIMEAPDVLARFVRWKIRSGLSAWWWESWKIRASVAVALLFLTQFSVWQDGRSMGSEPRWIEDMNYSISDFTDPVPAGYNRIGFNLSTPITIRPVLIRIECVYPVDPNKLVVSSALGRFQAILVEQRTIEIRSEAGMPPGEPLWIEISSLNAANPAGILRVMRWGIQ